MVERISSLDPAYRSGDLSIFPQALDSQDQLYVASNNSKTQLVQTLTYNGKVVNVQDTSGFPATGIIRVGPDIGVDGDFELIAYGMKTSTTFQQLQRGFEGSRQNVWRPQNIYVCNVVAADHHNAPKDAIINIEHDLGLVANPDPLSLNGILKSQEVRFLSPKPIFRAFPLNGPPPLNVRFQNFTTGHIIRNYWDFGDGSHSLDLSPNHIYLSEGKYTVQLQVVTSTGGQAVSVKSNYIEVSADDAAPFFYVDSISSPYSVQTAATIPTQPKTFVFVDQSGGDIVQRNWVFGDGQSSVQEDPDNHTASHVYALPGNYAVTLILIYANGCCAPLQLPDLLLVL